MSEETTQPSAEAPQAATISLNVEGAEVKVEAEKKGKFLALQVLKYCYCYRRRGSSRERRSTTRDI